MEILQNKSNTVDKPDKGADITRVISVVQGFVQMWIKYEAELHKDIAENQKINGKKFASNKIHSYINYGHFYKVSSIILQKKTPTMKELSNALSVPFSTATRIVDGLVDEGYIKRLPDPEDRRIVKVALTPEGLRLHRTIESFTGEHVQEILSCLSHQEQEALFELIRKVVSALQKVT